MMKRNFAFLFLLMVFVGSLHAQMMLYSNSSLKALRTEVDSSAVSYKSAINAVGTVVCTNLGVWSFDHFVTNAPFADISIHTIRNNFHRGFVWDNDFFNTNLFLHPYHGGLYFNAARSNGLDYWHSVPFSFGGSLMWEMFMEKEYPSINDLIATSVGGIGLGEITFRLSDRIIDERAYGLSRLGREAAVFLVSPVRGLNRLFHGTSWRHRLTKGNVMPEMPLSGYLRIGYKHLYDLNANGRDDVSSVTVLKGGFSYGNPYDEDNDHPYDYFSAQAYFNLHSSQPLISRFSLIGMLYSNPIKLKNPQKSLTWGIYQHFNYFESMADTNNVTLHPFKLAETAAFGPGILYKKITPKNNNFYASFYLSGIILGSSQSDHYNVYNRDYNMGSGFSTKLQLEWLFRKRFTVQLRTEDYRLYTWLGKDPAIESGREISSQGDRCKASLSLFTFNLDYRMTDNAFIGFESSSYYRSTDYKHYPTSEHGVFDNAFSIGWLF